MVAFMVLSVPWFFTGNEPSSTVLGLPDWAAYSLGVSLLNAAVAAWLISRHWDTLAGSDDIEDDVGDSEADTEDSEADAEQGAGEGRGAHGR